MKMYIANLTRQNHNLSYRVPGSGVRTLSIPVGAQVLVPGDPEVDAVNAIVTQLSRYGMRRADELDRTRAFSGICYSTDRPVPGAKIERGVRQNIAVLAEQGKVMRQEAAVAGNSILETSLAESGIPATLREMDTTIVEDKPDPRSETAPVAEGFHVTRHEGGGPPAARPQGTKKSRR